MKYFVFDGMGDLLNSYDSRTGGGVAIEADKEPTPGSTTTTPTTGTTTSPSTGDDVSVIPKAILPLSTFWTDTSPMPTEYQEMCFVVCQYDASHPANMSGETCMTSPGYVSAMSGTINGSTNGVNCYFQLYKNGQPAGLIASNASSDGKVNLNVTGGQSYTFVPGDVLSVWIRADQSYVNQSFSAFIEVTFTA